MSRLRVKQKCRVKRSEIVSMYSIYPMYDAMRTVSY